MKLRELFQGLEFPLLGDVGSVDVRGLTDDSREVESGYLFVCVRGFVTDGHNFAPQTMEKGAAALVVEEELSLPLPQVKVPDTRRILPYLARNFFGRPNESLNFMGITGTNGKTTVTHLLAHVLEKMGERVLLLGTVDYRLGEKKMKAERTTPPPLLLWRLLREAVDEGISHVVMEVSSHALSLGRVEGLQFQVSTFTNLSRDHLDFHKTMDHYYWAKSHLFTHYTHGVSVVNLDDPYGKRLEAEIEGDVLGFSLEGSASLRGQIERANLDGLALTVEETRGKFTVNSHLVGTHNARNLLAAWGTLASLGIDPGEIFPYLATFQGVRGRLEPVANTNGVGVFVDYAHTPDALKVVLETLGSMTQGRLILVFGCGGDRDRGKRPVMGSVASQLAHKLVVTSDNPRTEDPMAIIQDILKGTEGEVVVEPDRIEAIRMALRMAQPGDVVLIAGKGHEDYQIVGDEVFPFDDVKITREIMEELGWI
jgi:UDP-N-acetylmuramoyl-L-alanyl-D-glutamate--2,6-diaminopimelate ligase